MLCQISPGKLGACDRYGNVDGVLTRLDTVHLVARPGVDLGRMEGGTRRRLGRLARRRERRRAGLRLRRRLGHDLSRLQAGALHRRLEAQGVDMVTVVTEGIFSYCSFKVKIDTDRFLGAEQANVRYKGEAVGHVTTAEYGSQMLSLGGVHHLTGGSKKEGRIACEMMMVLGNKKPVEFAIDGGARIVIQAGKAPIVNGVEEQRMRVGCGSAAIGIFARQWFGHVDEVVVVDDHITGVLDRASGRPLPRHGAARASRCAAASRRPGATSRWPTRATAGAAPTSPIRSSIIEGWERARRAARPAPADDLDHRRARAVVRARRGARARAADAGRGAPHRRAHRRELRAVAVHGAVPRRRRRQPARRRHREPGAADARHQARCWST